MAKATRPAGICHVCGCTYEDPCPDGCGWANRQRTLCTVCAKAPADLRRVRRDESIERLGDELEMAQEAVEWLRRRVEVLKSNRE